MAVSPGAQPYQHDGGPVGVLLCHGFTGSPDSLRPWGERWAAAGHTVRIPLLPGHGARWQDMVATTWQDWYAEVDRAFAALRDRCSQVFVGGLSMGGALALRLAQLHGDQVTGLMLVNPSVLVRDRRLIALPLLRLVVPSVAGIGGDIAKPGTRELAYDRTPLRPLSSMLRLQALVRAELPKVTQPMIVWRSPADHVVPAESAALILRSTASVDVVERLCANSFHVVTLDHDAEMVFDESLAFARRLVPASAEG